MKNLIIGFMAIIAMIVSSSAFADGYYPRYGAEHHGHGPSAGRQIVDISAGVAVGAVILAVAGRAVQAIAPAPQQVVYGQPAPRVVYVVACDPAPFIGGNGLVYADPCDGQDTGPRVVGSIRRR